MVPDIRKGGNTMKKVIMFYINSLNRGGAERVILRLAYHFADAGFRSVVVTSFIDSNEYPVPDGVERISIEKEQVLQSRLKKNVSRIYALRRIAKEIKPDVLISFMCEPNFRAICATAGLGIKRIVSVRNDPNKEYAGKLGYLVGKILLPLADGCVFQTKDAQAWFPKCLRDKSVVIYNEVDSKFFDIKYTGSKRIVTMGRLTEQKNHQMLIQAFSQIANLFPDWELHIWGVGALESDLRAEICELNLQDRIILKGLTSDVPSVLKEAGIFVLSSDYEGMPNALMEALAVGVPSVSTDCPCGGPRMLIKHGENGMLTPVSDSDSLAHNIKLLIEDEQLARRMSRQATIMARAYAPEAVFSEWLRYVEKVIGR